MFSAEDIAKMTGFTREQLEQAFSRAGFRADEMPRQRGGAKIYTRGFSMLMVAAAQIRRLGIPWAEIAKVLVQDPVIFSDFWGSDGARIEELIKVARDNREEALLVIFRGPRSPFGIAERIDGIVTDHLRAGWAFSKQLTEWQIDPRNNDSAVIAVPLGFVVSVVDRYAVTGLARVDPQLSWPSEWATE